MQKTPTTKEILKYDSNDRNASFKLIDWFDVNLVKNAKILVVGAGAIGNEVLKNLALLGVENIFIFDRDTIEKSNLSRSILFRESDAGKYKAEVAARSIKDINPDIKPRWKKGDIKFDLGLGFINRMDVVIAGFDNVEARNVINQKCWTANRPWIEAGINVFDGQVAVYYPQKGPCYECLKNMSVKRNGNANAFSQIRDQIDRNNSCGVIASRFAEEDKVPTTPMIASIVAGVQVQEALKLLALKNWKDRNLIGKKFRFEGSAFDVSIYELANYQDCSVHQNIINSKKVVKLPEITPETTVKNFVAYVKKRFGKNSTVSFNFDFVVEMRCICGNIKPVLQPMNKQFRESLGCSCGWVPKFWDPSVFRITTVLANFNSYQCKKEFLASTLSDISIPQFEWLEVYSSDLKKDIFIEINNSDKSNFGFLKPGQENS